MDLSGQGAVAEASGDMAFDSEQPVKSEAEVPSEDGPSSATATLNLPSETTVSQQTTTISAEGTQNPDAHAAIEADPSLEASEARISQKKETTLREFLGKMDDYAPIIPDALTAHYLTLAGLPPPPQTPLPLARLLALATQKFIADIAADSYQYARIRSGHSTSNATNAGLAAAAAAAAAGGSSTLGGGGGGAAAAGPIGLGNAAGPGGAPPASGKGINLGTQRPGFGGGGAGTSNGSTAAAAGAGAQARTVLTMEDLGMAVGEYGVDVKRGEFYR